MRKLSSRGFSHLLVPVLAFLLVAGLGGAYFIAKSHAATTTDSTSQSTSSTTSSTAEPTPNSREADVTNTTALVANANAAVAAKNSSAGTAICLFWSSSYCMVTNGSGGSLTISSNAQAWAHWIIYEVGSTTVEFQNGAGNCLRNNSDGSVTMINGRCTGEDGERWYVTETSPFRFRSYKFNSSKWYMGTYGNVGGYKVWSLYKYTPNVWISWGLDNK